MAYSCGIASKPRLDRFRRAALSAVEIPAGGAASQEADDGVFISAYARDYPVREDIAESNLPYFAVRRRPERLSPADRSAILAAIPNRLEYFDRQGFIE